MLFRSGRTGRQAFRAWYEHRRDDFEIVAINRGPVALRTHLLRYDSDYGRFPAEIVDGTDSFKVGSHEVAVFNASSPADIPWGDADVDVVLECTGEFRDGKSAGQHVRDSVKKVVISAPGKSVDWTVIMGANDEKYDAKAHKVISAGSCTTNCVVLAIKVLHDAFGVERGFMSTIHSYTGDQNLVDGTHKDLRRARQCEKLAFGTRDQHTVPGEDHRSLRRRDPADGRAPHRQIRRRVDRSDLAEISARLFVGRRHQDRLRPRRNADRRLGGQQFKDEIGVFPGQAGRENDTGEIARRRKIEAIHRRDALQNFGHLKIPIDRFAIRHEHRQRLREAGAGKREKNR